LRGGRKVEEVDAGGDGGRARSRNGRRRHDSKRGSRSRSRHERERKEADGYTDAQMREAQNVSRVGSQVSRTSRHF